MTIAEVLLLDFDTEVLSTRRVLERLPDDKPTWKPHGKSFELGKLGFHVATLPNFGLSILETPDLDLGAKMDTFPRYSGETSAQLVQLYNDSTGRLRTKLAATSDDELQSNWKMTYGAHTIADAPRMVLYRTMFFNHLIHHRGQLNVYLRLLDIAVPGIYGPSADEPFGG